MIVSGFNVRKAAQVVAFFAREQGGKINVLKLIKLVYLADRESMKQFDAPILYDHMVAMAHGPVNSATLDLVNGMAVEVEGWAEFVGERQGHEVPLTHPVADTDLDELSKRDLRVLAAVWAEFGQMGQYQIRDYTHRYCLEWEDPHGSSNPIPYDRIFKFLGKADSGKLAQEIEAKQAMSILLERHSNACTADLDAL